MTTHQDPTRPVVLVAGIGQTGPRAADPRSIPEMVLDSVERALADAHLGFGDIQAVVSASVDLIDGLAASGVAVTEVVGAVMRPETRIAADGLAAAIHGACLIWAGAQDTVLVVAHGKASMAPEAALTPFAMDPIHLQPLGVDFLVVSGLQARLLTLADPGATTRWARIVQERRRSAPPGAVAPPVSAKDVLASPVAASPLTREMRAPPADAACAIVLRGRPAGTAAAGRTVALTGAGHDICEHAPGMRELARWEGLGRALARACASAGVAPGPGVFDLLEPSCRFPHEEELFLEQTGISKRTLLSPGGGLFGGDPPVAAGLLRLAAATTWLRQAGSGRALAHGAWGPAGQAQAVVVLEAAA